jgi:hypothetical protein
MTTLWNIFYCQSKFNALDGAGDMLIDFAAKAILKTVHGKEDICRAIQEYYRQCPEICEKKYNEGLALVAAMN